MRFIEARDGFIKFETNESITLSSFVQLDDNCLTFLAQIIQLKNTGISFIAVAKIIYSYDGAFLPYKGENISSDVKISKFSFDVLNKSLYSNNPIMIGNFVDENILIPIDKDCFNNKTLLSIDNSVNKNLILTNLINQFASQGKVIILDMVGDIEGTKYIAGVDIKLPLNTSALNFLFEDCLSDATSDSKNLIKEIFTDLSDYSKTVKFLPFTVLKSIVDDMVDKSHVFKLLVLKNKLARFEKLGCFAINSAESENITKILGSDKAIIDLSKLDSIFQNRYLSVIYSILETQNSKAQVFVNSSNAIDKRSLKTILTNQKISSSLVVGSKFRYLNEIKTMFENFIIEPSFTNNEVFKYFKNFLHTMDKNLFLVVGEGTNNLPLISKFEPIEITTAVLTNVNEEFTIEAQSKADDEVIIADESIEFMPNSEEDSETIAINKKSDDLIEKVAEEVDAQGFISTDNIFEVLDDEVSNEENLDTQILINEQDLEDKIESIDEIESNDSESADAGEIEEAIEADGSFSQDIEVEETVIEPEYIESIDSPVYDELEAPIEEASIKLDVTSGPDFHTEVEEIQTIEVPIEISELAEEAEAEANILSNLMDEENALQEDVVEGNDTDNSDDISSEDVQAFEERNSIDADSIKLKDSFDDYSDVNVEIEVLPIGNEENDLDGFDEIVELDESDLEQADIIVDIESSEGDVLDPEALDREIVEDVDKVFTTMKEDVISDSDLDFIDELNGEPIEAEETAVLESSIEELPDINDELQSDEDVLLAPIEEFDGSFEDDEQEKEILETRNSATPIVPVYNADIPAEDIVKSDPIEQGDTVTHAKHGVGVVEKMIKYGNKTLYSINFDNIGRRLLDPTLTEIKKA